MKFALAGGGADDASFNSAIPFRLCPMQPGCQWPAVGPADDLAATGPSKTTVPRSATGGGHSLSHSTPPNQEDDKRPDGRHHRLDCRTALRATSWTVGNRLMIAPFLADREALKRSSGSGHGRLPRRRRAGA